MQAACAASVGGRGAEADGEAFCNVIVLQNDTKKRLSSLNNAIFCKNVGKNLGEIEIVGIFASENDT